MIKTKICIICKKEFIPNHRTISLETGESRQKICSFECRKGYYKEIARKASKKQHLKRMKLKYENLYKGKGCIICNNKSKLENHHFLMNNIRKGEDGDIISLCFYHHKIIHKYLRIAKNYGYIIIKNSLLPKIMRI